MFLMRTLFQMKKSSLTLSLYTGGFESKLDQIHFNIGYFTRYFPMQANGWSMKHVYIISIIINIIYALMIKTRNIFEQETITFFSQWCYISLALLDFPMQFCCSSFQSIQFNYISKMQNKLYKKYICNMYLLTKNKNILA